MQSHITRKEIEEILKYLPIFGAPGYQFGEVIVKEGQFPWYKTNAVVDAFYQALYANNWITPFDWSQWRNENPDAEDLETIANADIDHLQKLLTSIIRLDRFSEGAFANALENGVVTAILHRLDVIAETPFDSS